MWGSCNYRTWSDVAYQSWSALSETTNTKKLIRHKGSCYLIVKIIKYGLCVLPALAAFHWKSKQTHEQTSPVNDTSNSTLILWNVLLIFSSLIKSRKGKNNNNPQLGTMMEVKTEVSDIRWIFVLTLEIFAYHSFTAVGRRSSAPANDFFDASLVDCCIAFWMIYTSLQWVLQKR